MTPLLIAERKKNHYFIYFISHAFRGAEEKYPLIEKMIFALVITTRKLKPYFQAHPIKVLTSHPMPKVTEGKNQSNWVMDWSNQLSYYGIEFKPRRAIKAQALVDFIAKCTSRPEPTREGSWELFVDGSSSKSSAELLVLDPHKNRIEYAIKFDFTTLNDKAEYEALLLCLQLCKTVGA